VPATTTPPSEPLDLVLHIGSGKTGTSSLQVFLHRNRARLAELGYLYPETPGRTRHTRLGLFIQPDDSLDKRPTWERERLNSTEDFRETFRQRLFEEISESGLSRVVFSDEALYGSPDSALERLHEFVDGFAASLRVVVYLRRQDDHLVSRYQQVVKVGETRRLDERTREMDFSRTYGYHPRLQKIRRILEPTEFVVRRFERENFAEGSLYQDFLNAAGIEVRAQALEQVEPVNESLDVEAVEFLRILNIFRAENDAPDLPKQNRPLVAKLARASTGPTLTLPPAVLDEFMAQWEESNQRVAREMLGDESGVLFHAPRKTRNTTTEQFLDPDRVAHFLALVRLPEHLEAPLRAVAEREAGSTARRA
jgi:hypothetical protein